VGKLAHGVVVIAWENFLVAKRGVQADRACHPLKISTRADKCGVHRTANEGDTSNPYKFMKIFFTLHMLLGRKTQKIVGRAHE
jgi:hypothetical protein